MRWAPSSSITRSSSPPVPQSPYSTQMRSYCLRPLLILARTSSGMRAGMLCSLAGRQVTVMCDQPFSAIRARTSRASAPQAIRSVRGGSGAGPGAVGQGIAVAAGRGGMGCAPAQADASAPIWLLWPIRLWKRATSSLAVSTATAASRQ